MRHHELMRRLAAARPYALDPDGSADPEVRRTELAGILTNGADPSAPHATTAPRTAEPGAACVDALAAGRAAGAAVTPEVTHLAPRARTSPQPRRARLPRRIAVMAAASAAVTATVLAAGIPGLDGPPGKRAPAASDDRPDHGDIGSRVLRDMAAKVERHGRPVGGGRFWYEEGLTYAVRHPDDADYRVVTRVRRRVWTEADSGDRWSRTDDLGTRPASPADRARWQQDGSPRTWRLNRLTLSWQGELVQTDAPGGVSDGARAGDVAPSDLPGLPAEPKALYKRLYALVDETHNAPKDVLHEVVMSAVQDIALNLPVTPDQRAAAYRLLARQPNVRDVGRVTAPDGRIAYAVAIRDSRGSGETQLLFEPGTGRPLGTRSLTVREGGGFEKGEIRSWNLLTEKRWTDDPPPHDEDYHQPPGPNAR